MALSSGTRAEDLDASMTRLSRLAARSSGDACRAEDRWMALCSACVEDAWSAGNCGPRGADASEDSGKNSGDKAIMLEAAMGEFSAPKLAPGFPGSLVVVENLATLPWKRESLGGRDLSQLKGMWLVSFFMAPRLDSKEPKLWTHDLDKNK